MLVTRNWLKEYIGEDIETTEKITELLMAHSFEIEGTSGVGEEEVIDVDILPNRSSDCLSQRGIAREVATLTGSELVHDPFREPVELPKTEKVKVTIHDTVGCRRFGMALMTGITIGESPSWLKERLMAVGQKPINNVVDATNYVMFSLGQPLHAYDADKFPQEDGAWKFGVRYAKEGEKITVLTGEEYELHEGVQLIVDASNDAPAGIAGIKGGAYAEIDSDTTAIILEAANFDPVITRKAAQSIRLQTDASKRFENEPSRELVPYALKEVVRLIEEIGGGTCEGYVDEYPSPYHNPEVTVTLSKINALLGLTLSVGEVTNILSRLGFTTDIADEAFTVTAPFERTDIQIAEDVIEEIGRVYGYGHIVSVVPESVSLSEINKRHVYSEKIRNLLVAEGYSEVITSSFRKKDTIELRNYLASDKGCLRSSLRKNITDALDRNVMQVELLNISMVRIFEIGTVFKKAEDGTDVTEHFSLAIGVRSKKQGYVPKDDEYLKEIQKKIEDMLGVSLQADIQNGVLECNLTALLEVLADVSAYDETESLKDVTYQPYSLFPYISRDIALWVPEDVESEKIKHIIVREGGELLIQTALFDEFNKEGKTSYAFRLIFQSMERTLTDEEVNSVMESIENALKNDGYEIR